MFSKIFKLGLALLLAALLPGMLAAQNKSKSSKKPPSLAQLARETRAKKAALEKRARTITDADLGGLNAKLSQGSRPEPATTGEAAGSEGPDAGTADDGVQEDDPFAINDSFDESLSPELLDESDFTPEQMAVWEDVFREARVNFQNAVNEALVLQLRMNNLENSYFAQSDGVAQESLEADLSKTMDAISTNKLSQQDSQAALDSVNANAAAAGLSPQQISELVGQLPGIPPEIEIREPEPDPDDPDSDVPPPGA